jgi:hypothetical protein
MEHSQYYHFPRHAREEAEIVVLPAEGHDCIGCFADQVKVTHALVLDLDEAVKEVKLLGEHGEEATQKIMELEALCKKLREDKTQLEGMVESHDELIMEFVDKYGYNPNDEDVDDEDDDDGGDTAAPHTIVPPAAAPEVMIIKEEDPMEMVPEKEAPKEHEVILVDAEPELLQSHLFNVLVRDYEESPSRMMDDLDDLDDPTEADYNVNEWFPEDGSNDRD